MLTKKCCQELTEDTHTVFEMLEFRKIMISCCSRMFQDTNLSRCKDLSVVLSLLHIKSIIFFLIKSSSCTEFLFLYVDIRSIVAFYEASQRRLSFYVYIRPVAFRKYSCLSKVGFVSHNYSILVVLKYRLQIFL